MRLWQVERAREAEEKAKAQQRNDEAAAILTRDAGVADVLGSKPLPPVDEAGLSPRALMVHRMRSKITDGGIRGKGEGPLSRAQLLASLQGQMGAKEALARNQRESDLDEERRYLEHVKAEMHLHATYSKAAELSKQRDLLAAWERDGHLKNLNKLKSLGPAAMRGYVRDVLAPTPAHTSASAARSASWAQGADGGLGATTGRSSARSGLGVGFDPRRGSS